MVRRERGVEFHPDVRHRPRHDLSLALQRDKGGHIGQAAAGRSARLYRALLEAGRSRGATPVKPKGGKEEMSIKVLAGATLLLLAAVLPAKAAEPIRIGFSCEETGGSAASGKQFLLTAQIWADRINKRGGLLGRPVELI